MAVGFQQDDPAAAQVETHDLMFSGVWAIFADVEFRESLKINPSRTRVVWLPAMLMFTAFSTSIILVNLMIAKMTSTYDKIRSESLYYRALQRCQFITEYKDERGAPPPVNLITTFLNLVPSAPTTYAQAHHHPPCLAPPCAPSTPSLSRAHALPLMPPPLLPSGHSMFARYIGRWAEHTRGFSVLMGRDAAVRLQSKERQLTAQFDLLERRREEASSESRIEEIAEDMPTVRAVSRRIEVLEAELFHLRTEHKKEAAANAARIKALMKHHRVDYEDDTRAARTAFFL